jgi:hypothetical protein
MTVREDVVGCGREERRPVSLVKLQFVSSIYKFIAVIRGRHEVFNSAVTPVSHKVHNVCGLNSCRVVVERVNTYATMIVMLAVRWHLCSV